LVDFLAAMPSSLDRVKLTTITVWWLPALPRPPPPGCG
jgi:hypothetical protein